MSKLTRAVIQQALELSPTEKAQVVDELLQSLNSPDPQIENAWLEEAEARAEAFDQGKIQSVPAENVLGKYMGS